MLGAADAAGLEVLAAAPVEPEALEAEPEAMEAEAPDIEAAEAVAETEGATTVDGLTAVVAGTCAISQGHGKKGLQLTETVACPFSTWM